MGGEFGGFGGVAAFDFAVGKAGVGEGYDLLHFGGGEVGGGAEHEAVDGGGGGGEGVDVLCGVGSYDGWGGGGGQGGGGGGVAADDFLTILKPNPPPPLPIIPTYQRPPPLLRTNHQRVGEGKEKDGLESIVDQVRGIHWGFLGVMRGEGG